MKKTIKNKGLHKLRFKYRLVLIDENDFEQKFSLRLSRLNVIGVVGAFSILWIIIMIYLLAFTSLREYIPGYTDPNLRAKAYKVEQKMDSIEYLLTIQNKYMNNLRGILKGEDIEENKNIGQASVKDYSTLKNNASAEDSILRVEVENQSAYNVYFYDTQNNDYRNELVKKGPMIFFKPINGIITSYFNPAIKHFGIDLVSERNDAVKSAFEGVIIFADWTINTGYVIAIQHPNNFITVYKHNSALLKKEGDLVKTGDPIAIIGNSGEQSSGPHLHFELWSNGSPVNPLNYISI